MTPVIAFLATLRSGFDPPVFRQRLLHHVNRWGIAYLLAGLGAWGFQHHFTFALNLSPSLPQRLFLIQKGVVPQRGDLVAFRWQAPRPYVLTVKVVKFLAGVPGDRVTRLDREFFVNGSPAGVAKTHSLKGAPLALGPTGIIPMGRYYISAPHPDSLDSRYAIAGWISHEQIIGKAYALF